MDALLGPDGWLLPGRHEVALDDVEDQFVNEGDARRVSIMGALRILVSACTEAWGGGLLLIAGDFVSRHPAPVSRPTIIVAPDNPSDANDWTDATAERITGFWSLHDVIVGSLGPDYIPVLHPLSGILEVLYCEPDDVEQVVQWVGTVTLADGSDVFGARGVLEVGW